MTTFNAPSRIMTACGWRSLTDKPNQKASSPQIGRHDMVTSARFAARLTGSMRGSELLIFEACAHAPIYERVEEFNQKTLSFLQRPAA
ncbi:MAG: alpha/beta hydrolase [Verrucomicrobia bacterium]|nr:alpha/beta hydrolase [Verrucomicrobiota bacterium]